MHKNVKIDFVQIKNNDVQQVQILDTFYTYFVRSSNG